MTNYLIQNIKKSIPFFFILIQILVCLTLWKTKILTIQHLLFAIFASITYILTAYSNPGYIIYTEQCPPPPPISTSQPIIPFQFDLAHFSHKLNQEIPSNSPNQPEIQLGINSNIKEQRHQSKLQTYFTIKNKKLDTIYENQPVKQAKSHLLFPHKQAKPLEMQIIGSSIVKEQNKINFFSNKLKNISRWCRGCKHNQQMRVRHCIDCKKCVSTFDHHCPWMNNCIGQKNKLQLIFYIIFENIQLYHLIFTIQSHLQNSYYEKELLFLWLVIVFLTVVFTGMFIVQIFLISRNITTWEYARWKKIEYLKNYDQKRLKSLFNCGIANNLRIFFEASCKKQSIKWLNYISSEAHHHLIPQTITQRRIHKQF